MDRRKFLNAAAYGSALFLAGFGGGASALAAVGRSRSASVRKKRVVAIDAGHGGKDPGAIGARGAYEKDITLAVAQELASKLEASGRFQAVMTRSQDRFIALGERVRRARFARAELMLSLHADAAGNPDKHGFSVYTLADQASDAFAEALAKRENAADLAGGLNLDAHPKVVRTILLDLMAREVSYRSSDMARHLVHSLNPPFVPLQNPHRQANFAVLRAPELPSILVEMGFMSNSADERQLIQRSVQSQIADRLMRSVDHFFQAG